MKRLIIFPLLILCCSAMAFAEIYTWTDDKGTVTFTDDSARIPSGYSNKKTSGEYFATRTQKTHKINGTRSKRKLQAAIPRNRVKSIAAAKAQQTDESTGMHRESKGHLGDEPTDSAHPDTSLPKPLPAGDRPKPASPGKEPS